ncbi:PilZ domain-containing protein [Hydrogenivirga caldilitoris]|uniref:PilZ domain-containing protein n=1 Tax=Hydrogenivirga caldilitoris TaxID=246264 RepID=A0A497XMI5_9AQUI|nr:PilZ domain-containing protein [Hydrogenivirga caldilitoris]RLJ70085.1 PilZ domain-containing protein [Hydrogenivirga caldilitoris]
MDKLKVSEIFKVGDQYDIVTKYKEIPVKVQLRLKWVDNEGRLLGFDWGKTHIRAAFSTLDPVYIRLSSKEYAQTQVFSNLGKELVLTLENFVEPPEFIKRHSVRVEPDDNRPVIVELTFDGHKFELPVKDISERGIGLSLKIDENKEFVKFLQDSIEELKEDESVEFPLKIHLPENGTAVGKGRLKNVVGLGKDIYVRLGFEVDFPKEELTKIRRYVINRQKEIIQALRFIE